MDIFDYFKKIENSFSKSFKEINKSLSPKYKKPSCEISQSKDNVTIKADLPGVTKKNITLKITHDYLDVSAEKSRKEIKKSKGFYKEEKKYFGYKRVIPLPPGLITDKTSAKFKGSKLIIKIPKVKTGKIKIK